MRAFAKCGASTRKTFISPSLVRSPILTCRTQAQQIADDGGQVFSICGLRGQEAVAQSGMEMPLKGQDGYRSACIIGSGIGGLTTLEFSYEMLFKENKRATHPLTLLKAIGSSASAHVSIDYGITGPTFGIVERLLNGHPFYRSHLPHDPRGPGRSRPLRRGGSVPELGAPPGPGRRCAFSVRKASSPSPSAATAPCSRKAAAC